MARKSLVAREKKKQLCVKKYAPQRLRLRLELKKAITFSDKLKIQQALQRLPKNSSPVRLHNRCAITNRPKGYFRQFGLSRHMLREMAHQGVLPGITKSSW